MSQFLHEEGISCGTLKDQVPKLWGHIAPFQDRLHELSTGFKSQLIKANPVKVGFTPPLVRVLRPVEEDQEYLYLGKPANEIIKEIFCGLIDSVEILNRKDKKPFLTATDNKIPKGLKDPLTPLLGLEL